MKQFRENKKRTSENYARKIKLARDPRSKALYRKQKTSNKESFDKKIDVLKKQNERLREQNKRTRESIRRRH